MNQPDPRFPELLLVAAFMFGLALLSIIVISAGIHV